MKTEGNIPYNPEKTSARDIVKLNRIMKSSYQQYQSLFEHNSDIVFSVDLFGRIISVNPRFKEAFGFTESQIIRKSALNFLKAKDIERVANHFFQALNGVEQNYEIELVERDGEEKTYLIKHIPIVIDGVRTGVFGIGRDITAQKKAEEKVAYLAYYDPATALPNRQNFHESLKVKLEESKKSKEKLAVLFIDFDRFKLINDSLGHRVGDELLKWEIERISALLPANCYFARFGGDKFSLSYTGFESIDEVISMAKSILITIKQPIKYLEKEFYVTASIGVSLYPNDGIAAESLLKNADAAMNQAKKLGGNKIKFYSDEMNSQALYRIELESYLRKALEKNEFFLCYQPFIDIDSKAVIGAEALIRWNHPKLGLVPPADFIPLAEETGLITEIGGWVLETACVHTKNWQQVKGYQELNISVNVAAQQFQQPSFVSEVKHALTTSGLSARHLHLELTESAMLKNACYSIEVMKELQGLGVKISVDDFGTGYSSLSYLRDLPINNLKIDRSFIKNLRAESKDLAIVHAIITMGKGLNLNVIAEGIETEEQLSILRQLTCDVAQGYYLSKPKEQREFEKYMSDSQPSLV
ncbi:sensor domain-containing protein [Sutcliffiella horikoshii]|uniref:sensor domain-containing protein n=1 Tax=Sutcliffiella horikoshii TaxID=79883 RepID=UPI001CFD0130|nr:EAL domain-containing protein [Sutcliffiella horikoshii]